VTVTIFFSISGHKVIAGSHNYFLLLPFLISLPSASTSVGDGSCPGRGAKPSFLEGLGHE
jgi:hypothetical protein